MLERELNRRDSEVDKVCRLVIYAIDATNPFDIKAERIGRLPLEKGRDHWVIWLYTERLTLQVLGSPLPVLLIPLKDHPEAFLLLTVMRKTSLSAS